MTARPVPDPPAAWWRRYALVTVAAAAAGWLTAWGMAPTPPSARTDADRRPPAPPPRAPVAESAWRSQLPSLRATTGAASETAWIKWAFALPDDALAAAIAELNPLTDFHPLRCLYARWVKIDPGAAWASFRRSSIPIAAKHYYIPTSLRRDSGLVYGSLGTNPRSTIAAVMLHAWKSVAEKEAVAFAATLTVAGTPEAKAIPVHSYELKRILGEVAPAPPPARKDAATWASEADAAMAAPDRETRTKTLNTTLRQWMETDPAAASQWLRDLPVPRRHELDLPSLAAAAKQGSSSTLTHTAVLLLGQYWNPEVKIDYWNKQMTTGMQGDPIPSMAPFVLATRSVAAWTAEAPEAALGFVSSLTDEPLKAVLAGEAAGVLLRNDPDAAIALVNGLHSHQEVALQGLMRAWVEIDARASLDWAAQIEDTALRDACRELVSRMLVNQDPDLALEAALGLSNPATRQGVHQMMANTLAWNPAALARWNGRFPEKN
jgi:hypothetical protein